MKSQDVINHFGSKANTARALNISRPSVTNWGEIVPEPQALKVEKLSGGKLKADLKFYAAHKATRLAERRKRAEEKLRQKIRAKRQA